MGGKGDDYEKEDYEDKEWDEDEWGSKEEWEEGGRREGMKPTDKMSKEEF